MAWLGLTVHLTTSSPGSIQCLIWLFFSFHCWGSELCFQRIFHQYSKLFSKRQQRADFQLLAEQSFFHFPLFHYFALPSIGFQLAFDLPVTQLGVSEILLQFSGSSEEFYTIHKCVYLTAYLILAQIKLSHLINLLEDTAHISTVF